ncbi:MAG: hypothetical protein ACRDDA_01495 [Aeromonas sp.]
MEAHLVGAETLKINPKTGTTSFGTLPELTLSRGLVIPAGDIILKDGRIWREKKGTLGGFGAKHIWQDHRRELIEHGYNTKQDIPRFVSDIIVTGADVFHESNKGARVNILQSSLGIVILEFAVKDGSTTHSVISAYTRKTSRGTRVHTI